MNNVQPFSSKLIKCGVFHIYYEQISFLFKGFAVFLNISAINPSFWSFVHYRHSVGSFISNLSKVLPRPTARRRRKKIGRFFFSESIEKREFISNISPANVFRINEPCRAEKEEVASLSWLTKTNSSGDSARESAMRDARCSECYFGIFSWRISAQRHTRNVLSQTRRRRTAQIYGNLAYILDKSVLWDELGRRENIVAFAKHSANLIRSFRVGSCETETCAFTHRHTSR